MKPVYLLAILPFAGLLSGGWLSGHMPTLTFGFPFLLVWNVFWMVGTSLVLMVIYLVDRGDEKARR